MYHIGIVEDEREFAEQLQEFLRQYQREENLSFKISVFVCPSAHFSAKHNAIKTDTGEIEKLDLPLVVSAYVSENSAEKSASPFINSSASLNA